MTKLLMIFTATLLLSGCANNPDAKSLLETLEFGDDETGCFRVTGTVDVGASMFASSSVAVSLVKKKKGGDDDPAPDC